MVKDIKQGNIVVSLNGKDKGEHFIVCNVKENYAYVVNGKTRKLTKPKKKNIKHLQIVCRDCNLDFKNVFDCDIIHTIKNYISLKNSVEEKK